MKVLKRDLKNKTKKPLFFTRVALCSALMCVSAMISLPAFVPVTLQTFTLYFVLFAFGGLVGFYTANLYILIGVLGLPVFSNFRGGAGELFSPSGGFIIGFSLAALVYFLFEKLPCRKYTKAAGTIASLVMLYFAGVLHIAIFYSDGFENGFFALIFYYALPYVVPDTVKIVLAYYISKRVRSFI